MNFFPSTVPTLVFFLIWIEINLVKCEDLQFWNRDSNFDLRRANEPRELKVADFKDVAISVKELLEKHVSQRIHRRPKLKPMQGREDRKPLRYGRHHNNRERPRWPKPKVQPTVTHKHKINSSKPDDEYIGTIKSYPKKRMRKKTKEMDVEPWYVKSDPNKINRATKLIPVYLRDTTTEEPIYIREETTEKLKHLRWKTTQAPKYLRWKTTEETKHVRGKLPNGASIIKDKYEEPKFVLKTQKHKGRQKQAPKDHEALNGLSPLLTPYNIQQHLDDLFCKFPKANITKEVIGKTLSYHDIILLKISEKKSDLDSYFRADDVNKFAEEGPEKKIVFIVHGLSVMGAYELPCLTIALDFVQLLDYYLLHLERFDIFVVPMANPDGIIQSQSESLWNKNVSPQKSCAGVALDRNFDVAWNETRNISSCRQQYPGTNPFSEPESQAIREVIHRYSTKIVAYFHVHGGTFSHSFFKGDAVLYPKGYTEIQSEDDKYIDLKGEIDEAIQLAGFRVISVAVDTLYSWYGKVTGTSVDYATTIYGIPYAMEMVMQPYSPADAYLQKAALSEIWKRVINVTLYNIHRNVG